LLLIPLVLACLALSPRAQAAPNSNTSYGRGALPGNTSGDFNSAFGVDALHMNSTGDANTATGAQALLNNTGGTITQPLAFERSSATPAAPATQLLGF
jgi:hypothetical protein